MKSYIAFGLSFSLLVLGGCDRETEEVMPTLVKELNQVTDAMANLKSAVAKNPSIETTTRFDVEVAARIVQSFDLDTQMEASVEDARMAQTSQSNEPLSDALQVLIGANVLSALSEVNEALGAAELGLEPKSKEHKLLQDARSATERFSNFVAKTAAKRKKPESDGYSPWASSDMGSAGTNTNPYFVAKGMSGSNPTHGRLAHTNPYFKNNSMSGEIPPEAISIVLAPGETATCSISSEFPSEELDVSVVNAVTKVRKKIFPYGDRTEFSITGPADAWSIHRVESDRKKLYAEIDRVMIKKSPVRCERAAAAKPDVDTRPLTKEEIAALDRAEMMMRESDTNFAVLLDAAQDEILEGEDLAQGLREFSLLSRMATTYTKTQRAMHVLGRIRAAGSVNGGILQVAEMEARTSFAILLGQEEQIEAMPEAERTRFQTISNASKARHDVALNAIRNMK